MNTEPFPPEVNRAIDRYLAELPRLRELDDQGRYIHGTYAGLTPGEVLAQRESFRRMVGE